MNITSSLPFLLATMSLSLPIPACNAHKEEHHEVAHKVVATTPLVKDVTITQEYVCQIHSQRHIEIRALERGYLEAIPIKEGQSVEAGTSLFKILPVLYQTRLDAEMAEAQVAQLEYNYTKKLFEDKVVSKNEVLLLEAKLKKAQAKAQQAAAELAFTNIKAPYDGIVDRLHHQQGSLVEEGDVLTTLSDNSIMWVYFNVPESRYLEYQADLERKKAQGRAEDPDLQIELKLANHQIFSEVGKIGAIEADFNNETGNISFRADFPNPTGLLRHGQTGTVLINRILKDAIVIPQRATFETLDKQYVFVVGEDGAVHQRVIKVAHELDDIYVLEEGLSANEKIIFEGIRQVHEGEKVECEFLAAENVLSHLKYHAE